MCLCDVYVQKFWGISKSHYIPVYNARADASSKNICHVLWMTKCNRYGLALHIKEIAALWGHREAISIRSVFHAFFLPEKKLRIIANDLFASESLSGFPF